MGMLFRLFWDVIVCLELFQNLKYSAQSKEEIFSSTVRGTGDQNSLSRRRKIIESKFKIVLIPLLQDI